VVAVFGGLTLWLDDPAFIKMKPTIVQALFAAILLGGLAFGRPLLRPVLGMAMPWPLSDHGWRVLTLRWGVFFAVMAVLNEVVWRTQSTDVWVNFKVFGILLITLAFAAAQAPLLYRHKT
jgi:intracellular septation protein